jgi:hypothetical protein
MLFEEAEFLSVTTQRTTGTPSSTPTILLTPSGSLAVILSDLFAATSSGTSGLALLTIW